MAEQQQAQASSLSQVQLSEREEAPAPQQDTVILVSAEGQEFVVPRRAAECSNLIKEMLQAGGLSLSLSLLLHRACSDVHVHIQRNRVRT